MKSIKTALLGLTMLTGLSGVAMAADAFVPADTYAQMGWYLRGDAGFSWINYDGDDGSGIAVGGGLGYQYSDNMRADIRADWAGLGDDPSLATITGNFYFDIPLDTVLTPYLGAGAGYGWATRDNGDDDHGFAFALMAGAELSLTDQLSADIGYRYRQILSGDDPSDHQILVGLRYKF